MKKTAEELKSRISKLQAKDPITNKNIINKLKRRVRALEG